MNEHKTPLQKQYEALENESPHQFFDQKLIEENFTSNIMCITGMTFAESKNPYHMVKRHVVKRIIKKNFKLKSIIQKSPNQEHHNTNDQKQKDGIHEKHNRVLKFRSQKGFAVKIITNPNETDKKNDKSDHLYQKLDEQTTDACSEFFSMRCGSLSIKNENLYQQLDDIKTNRAGECFVPRSATFSNKHESLPRSIMQDLNNRLNISGKNPEKCEIVDDPYQHLDSIEVKLKDKGSIKRIGTLPVKKNDLYQQLDDIEVNQENEISIKRSGISTLNKDNPYQQVDDIEVSQEQKFCKYLSESCSQKNDNPYQRLDDIEVNQEHSRSINFDENNLQVNNNSYQPTDEMKVNQNEQFQKIVENEENNDKVNENMRSSEELDAKSLSSCSSHSQNYIDVDSEKNKRLIYDILDNIIVEDEITVSKEVTQNCENKNIKESTVSDDDNDVSFVICTRPQRKKTIRDDKNANLVKKLLESAGELLITRLNPDTLNEEKTTPETEKLEVEFKMRTINSNKYKKVEHQSLNTKTEESITPLELKRNKATSIPTSTTNQQPGNNCSNNNNNLRIGKFDKLSEKSLSTIEKIVIKKLIKLFAKSKSYNYKETKDTLKSASYNLIDNSTTKKSDETSIKHTKISQDKLSDSVPSSITFTIHHEEEKDLIESKYNIPIIESNNLFENHSIFSIKKKDEVNKLNDNNAKNSESVTLSQRKSKDFLMNEEAANSIDKTKKNNINSVQPSTSNFDFNSFKVKIIKEILKKSILPSNVKVTKKASTNDNQDRLKWVTGKIIKKHTSQTPRELTVKKGVTVNVLKTQLKYWTFIEYNGVKGLVPEKNIKFT